ncbi:hypothetical protein LPJ66_005588 [Kickxella alabastrina]|uniref:Uncharacterized protein n=1 Tax=Kickxella alabastrina TaxID=61397 RepID=A0ACC1IDV9_9FUNG|nr:hypothetical protein LPJ66_005588 [Kickxella alabastrina]
MFKRSLASTLTQGMRAFSTARAVSSALRAGVLLQRDPIVIQQAKGLEAASDKYFEWLEYISAERFPRDFFFKKGSSAEAKWMDLEDARASEWYFDPASKPAFKSVKKVPVEDEAVVEPARLIEVQPRETQADISGDVRSLERKLDRTLYLLVKDSAADQWGLPQGAIEGDELLHEAARRNLKDICGGKMNVWMVGNGPVGHCQAGDQAEFFLKGHILAGQANPDAKLATDFKWATREEVEATVSAEYWQQVKDMLSTV